MQGWTLPTTVTVGGKPYAVHTDYRDILDIIDHLQNTDDNEQERWYIAMALFYENWRDIPAQNRQEAAERMAEFIACGKTQGKPGAKREIDWQQDAELIVGGVNKVAGCEVRALPYLHWWTFIAYFMNIGSGPLATVVGIRHKLAKGQKLEKWEQQFYRENKEIVDLRPQLTKEEEAEKAAPSGAFRRSMIQKGAVYAESVHRHQPEHGAGRKKRQRPAKDNGQAGAIHRKDL